METRTYKFEGLGEMVDIVRADVELVDEKPLFILPEGSEEVHPLARRNALIGQRSQQFFGYATDQYQLVQHYEVAEMVSGFITEHFPNLHIKGTIKTTGPKMRLNFMFPDHTFDDNTSQGIYPGAFVNHSIDGRGSLAGGARFYKVICTNGMMFKTVIPEASFSVKHIGDFEEKVKKSFGLLTSGIEIIQRIETLIGIAVEDRYRHFTRDGVFEVLQRITGSKRLAKYIIEVGELNPENFTRYELYNDITRYFEHNSRSINHGEKYDIIAEKLLTGEIPVMLEENKEE